ncbi:MAG: actin-binding WH2 domain-containing protein [Cyanobacteria bacterium P01_A01_bin.135]
MPESHPQDIPEVVGEAGPPATPAPPPKLKDGSTSTKEHPHPPQAPRFSYSREEMRSLRQALEESNLLHLSIYFLDYLLRAQTALFEQIFTQRELPRIILSMSVLSAILAGVYGVVMGMYNGVLQAIASGVKLPILFLLTAIICIPSLYTFNVLLGQSFKFLQTVTLMVMTIGTTTILLASLAPIAFFFTLTTQNYQFMLLLHVLIFGLCGIYGVRYLYRGCAYLAFRLEQPLNTLLLRIWIAIYAVVGMQLGWRLRPFIGHDGSPFQLLREQGDGNFYLSIWRAALNLF